MKVMWLKLVLPRNLKDRIWDAFLVLYYQDEQWHDSITRDLIVKKITGEEPLEYVNKHLKN